MIYPFVVLTSLKGVYIFVAFVCKTRVTVLKLIRDAFQTSKRDVLVSTQNCASTLSKASIQTTLDRKRISSAVHRKYLLK